MWRFQSAWQGGLASRAGSGTELGLRGRQQKRKSPITCTRSWGDKPSSALGSQPRGCTAARGSVPLQLKLRNGGGRKEEASSSAPTSHLAWCPKSSPNTERPKACSSPNSASPDWWHTYKFEHVPVKHVVIGEALAVEKIPEKLPQVGVVGLVVKTQGAAEIQVCGKLSCKTRDSSPSAPHHRMVGMPTARETRHACACTLAHTPRDTP
uniref:Uncharacterized protein n=1 Tax=Canis lupus dingo TaxID=286419 RepID=A0A8C0KIK9_CANLU